MQSAFVLSRQSVLGFSRNGALSDLQPEPIAVIDPKRVTNANGGDDLNLV